MTDVLFGKILEKLEEAHVLFPDLRFGSVLQNALDSVKRRDNVNLNDLSSKELFKCLEKYVDVHKFRRGKG